MNVEDGTGQLNSPFFSFHPGTTTGARKEDAHASKSSASWANMK